MSNFHNNNEYKSSSMVAAGVTAIVVAFEMDGLKTLHTLKMKGKRVPQDISLAAWLDPFADLYADPPLTGIYQDFTRIAQNALAMLNRLLHKEPVSGDVVVDYLFFERCTALPASR